MRCGWGVRGVSMLLGSNSFLGEWEEVRKDKRWGRTPAMEGRVRVLG